MTILDDHPEKDANGKWHIVGKLRFNVFYGSNATVLTHDLYDADNVVIGSQRNPVYGKEQEQSFDFLVKIQSATGYAYNGHGTAGTPGAPPTFIIHR